MSIAEKNKELLRRFLIDKDKEANEELVMNNISLVTYLIEKYFPNINREDYRVFLSDGYLGLENAIINFDPDKIDSVSFTTYASKCIINQIHRTMKNYYDNNNFISFSSLVPGSDELTLEDIIGCEDEGIIDFEEHDYLEYKRNKVDEAINSLNPRQRKIAVLYYGFEGNEPLTQAEIGKQLHVSRAEISRLLININEKLKIKLIEFKGDYRRPSSRR